MSIHVFPFSAVTSLCIPNASMMPNMKLELNEYLFVRGKGEKRNGRREGRKQVLVQEVLSQQVPHFVAGIPVFSGLSYLQQSFLKQSCLLRMLLL